MINRMFIGTGSICVKRSRVEIYFRMYRYRIYFYLNLAYVRLLTSFINQKIFEEMTVKLTSVDQS